MCSPCKCSNAQHFGAVRPHLHRASRTGEADPVDKRVSWLQTHGACVLCPHIATIAGLGMHYLHIYSANSCHWFSISSLSIPLHQMRHPDYPLWSAIGLLAVVLPAPWHWRSRNVSTICLISWLTTYNIILFINTLVWADNFANILPVWCDISERRERESTNIPSISDHSRHSLRYAAVFSVSNASPGVGRVSQ